MRGAWQPRYGASSRRHSCSGSSLRQQSGLQQRRRLSCDTRCEAEVRVPLCPRRVPSRLTDPPPSHHPLFAAPDRQQALSSAQRSREATSDLLAAAQVGPQRWFRERGAWGLEMQPRRTHTHLCAHTQRELLSRSRSCRRPATPLWALAPTPLRLAEALQQQQQQRVIRDAPRGSRRPPRPRARVPASSAQLQYVPPPGTA